MALGLVIQGGIAAARGRTPGKRALRLKAVGRDGREATRGQIAIRELAKNPTYVLPPATRGRLVPMRLVLVMALVTADWISLLAGPSGRTLHDRVCRDASRLGTWCRVVDPRFARWMA